MTLSHTHVDVSQFLLAYTSQLINTTVWFVSFTHPLNRPSIKSFHPRLACFNFRSLFLLCGRGYVARCLLLKPHRCLFYGKLFRCSSNCLRGISTSNVTIKNIFLSFSGPYLFSQGCVSDRKSWFLGNKAPCILCKWFIGSDTGYRVHF